MQRYSYKDTGAPISAERQTVFFSAQRPNCPKLFPCSTASPHVLMLFLLRNQYISFSEMLLLDSFYTNPSRQLCVGDFHLYCLSTQGTSF